MNICVVRFDLDRPYIFIGDVTYTQGCHYGPAYIRRLIDEYRGVWKNGGFPFPPPLRTPVFHFQYRAVPLRSSRTATASSSLPCSPATAAHRTVAHPPPRPVPPPPRAQPTVGRRYFFCFLVILFSK
jgi:hypothetical protein